MSKDIETMKPVIAGAVGNPARTCAGSCEGNAYQIEIRRLTAERDAIAEALGGMIYCCTRQWSAWAYGTMSQNDFVLASEDDGILDELTAAAVSAIEAALMGESDV